MADFSKIEVVKVKEALNNLLNKINTNAIENAITNLPSYRNSTSKDKFISALSTQKDTNYENLKNKINTYLSVADYIQERQNLNSDNKDLKKKRDSAKNSIYTYETRYKKDSKGEYLYDKWGNHQTETITIKNESKQKEYDNYVKKIKSNNSVMSDYETKINSLI